MLLFKCGETSGSDPNYFQLFANPVTRAEYRSPTGSILARPCSSSKRVFRARRVGRAPGGARIRRIRRRLSRAPEGVVLVTFAETQFCREQNWAHFSAPAGPKLGMASVKSHPGCGAEQPAIMLLSRARSARTIQGLDSGLRRNDNKLGFVGTTTASFGGLRQKRLTRPT
jgi:hypothetical protein